MSMNLLQVSFFRFEVCTRGISTASPPQHLPFDVSLRHQRGLFVWGVRVGDGSTCHDLSFNEFTTQMLTCMPRNEEDHAPNRQSFSLCSENLDHQSKMFKMVQESFDFETTYVFLMFGSVRNLAEQVQYFNLCISAAPTTLHMDGRCRMRDWESGCNRRYYCRRQRKNINATRATLQELQLNIANPLGIHSATLLF